MRAFTHIVFQAPVKVVIRQAEDGTFIISIRQEHPREQITIEMNQIEELELK